MSQTYFVVNMYVPQNPSHSYYQCKYNYPIKLKLNIMFLDAPKQQPKIKKVFENEMEEVI